MEKLLKFVRAVLFYISVIAMGAMLAIIFYQVITRYVFNFSPDWSEELARMLFVWVVFLGSALIMGEEGHLAVQILPRKFEGTAFGDFLQICINVCSYIFIGLLIVQGTKMTRTMSFQTSPGLGLSMSFVYFVMPLSGLLMLLYLIKDSIRIYRCIVTRRQSACEVPQQTPPAE
ncbi:TRAP transporter small permease [Oceanidesulfovibrio marinus]|uniref:TRAP transporter small permease n=1 Tax=Oceanidesulfovibrio marinus TaxID=370038 RepID=A0A6P1ZM21_9BACT|nr:TRAP transporter small permease [Oceanidesulfovibrio marinus]QJT08739.1 TRAP transporter small permease [Oceanidesulfovibrio marinus]TVM36833.1 TRAP transporter small permease [Oceanidesulfovibrio marinus]